MCLLTSAELCAFLLHRSPLEAVIPQSKWSALGHPNYYRPVDFASAMKSADVEGLTVVVNVEKAADLVLTDPHSHAEVFVELRAGAQKHKTAVQAGTLNPVWGEQFRFDGCTASELEVTVYDDDTVMCDRVAAATVRFSELHEAEEWVPLSLEGSPAGRMLLGFQMK